MTKKDEKDADRPHYYSQFWLDVAAGRRVIGAPKPEDDGDLADVDLPEPTPLVRKGGRINANSPLDGYKETRATAAVAEPDYEEEELIEPDEDIIEPADQVDDEDIPNIVDDTPEVVSVEVEPASADEEEELDEGEEFFDEEAEDEEEEDEEWPARGRKKPKPGRPVKAPKPPVKKPKRGRGF